MGRANPIPHPLFHSAKKHNRKLLELCLETPSDSAPLTTAWSLQLPTVKVHCFSLPPMMMMRKTCCWAGTGRLCNLFTCQLPLPLVLSSLLVRQDFLEVIWKWNALLLVLRYTLSYGIPWRQQWLLTKEHLLTHATVVSCSKKYAAEPQRVSVPEKKKAIDILKATKHRGWHHVQRESNLDSIQKMDQTASRQDTHCCSLYHPTDPPWRVDAVICILRPQPRLLGSAVTG